MGDLTTLNETLCFIDVFRFFPGENDLTKLEKQIEAITSQNDAQSATSNKLKSYSIACLDMSQKLYDKKVIDRSDSNPWHKLQEIIFERLMIEDYSTCQQRTLSIDATKEDLISSPNFESNSLGNEFNSSDGQIIRYLYGCYFRLNQLRASLKSSNRVIGNSGQLLESLSSAETCILDQVVLYLTERDLFPDRDKRVKNNQPTPLLLNIVKHYLSRNDDIHSESIQKFVNAIGESCQSIGDPGMEEIIGPTYARLSQNFVKMSIDEVSLSEWFNITRVFVQNPDLAQKFLEKNILKKDNSIAYQSTLLGFMLCISHLPRASKVETTFFANPMRSGESDLRFTENQLGVKLNHLGQELHKIFHILLKSPKTRNDFLSWVGRCLNTFKDRKKLWSNQLLMNSTPISVNDGFLMNFLTVMLHLSEPFAGPYRDDLFNLASATIDKKLLRVDPTYCKYSAITHENSQTHFLSLNEETFLISADSRESSPDREYQPNFISECFYGTHQAFLYGFKSIYERFTKLAQSINELHMAYADAMAQPAPSGLTGPDPREMLKERVNGAMTQFFNLKAAMMVPNRVNMQLHFCIATAAYLNHLVTCGSLDEVANAKDFRSPSLEDLRLKRTSRVCLEYIPEMLIENTLDFFSFLKHFNEQVLSSATGILGPLMTMIITFMGNSSLMQNPHLRARFAEILECLMPHQGHHGQLAMLGCEVLFETHPLIEELAPSLVNVFVSIEMTGEGVQFEQKFSYRRPMYVVLEYLWHRPLHRRILIKLADEAVANIDSSRPPLFLRFVNLLMNDAIFLLDEALGFMNQLREAERRKKTDEWKKLNHQQRMQAEASYTHIGRLARFHNVLSLSTIGTIAWLTTEIKTIFCHPTLVDRIANMLNYFLEHLVGPKKSKFNVNDKNEYEFKPREVLEKIARIYINLGQAEGNKKYREFCTAVSSDGRSYSENLLPKASEILYKISGMSSLGAEFEKLSQLVHKIAVRNQMDEIPVEDIPDVFLDPIMSTLMVDPVLLPSSKIIVDRSTISRHLLSDQTDPFNRSPLSMEDVIPEIDLKKQIDCFLKERRDAQKATEEENRDVN